MMRLHSLGSRPVFILALLASPPLLSGCSSLKMAEPAVKQALQAKEFTVYVDGQQKILTLPEVMTQYDPMTRRLKAGGFVGMMRQVAGPRAIEVEVIEKVAFETYIAACRLATDQDFDGSKLPQNTLQVKVDTETGTIEPMDGVARSYFEIERSRFGN